MKNAISSTAIKASTLPISTKEHLAEVDVVLELGLGHGDEVGVEVCADVAGRPLRLKRPRIEGGRVEAINESGDEQREGGLQAEQKIPCEYNVFG